MAWRWGWAFVSLSKPRMNSRVDFPQPEAVSGLAGMSSPSGPTGDLGGGSAVESRGTFSLDSLERFRSVLSAHRHRVALGLYALITSIALALAFSLRFELSWPAQYTRLFLLSLPLLVGIRFICNRLLKLSTGRWRFVGTHDVMRLIGATVLGSVLFYLATRVLPFPVRVPRSVILIEWVLTTYLTAGIWIAYRTGFEQLRHRRAVSTRPARRVLIAGAGDAGSMLAREMSRIPTGYRPIGFVDDDPKKWGTRLNGLEVIGSIGDLRAIATAERADEIIIAVPSATTAQLRSIVSRCEATGLPFKILPGIAKVLAGEANLGQLRELRIEDLLGREPINLELPELKEDLRGQSVLITGAAGSIGSELARQVALHRPSNLVLYDQSETELFYLELELRERHPDLRMVPVIGDIVDVGGVERVFQQYRPDRVFHAAAYKHVPMMEANCREAVRNNVVGTWRVAEASGRYGIEKFVLVSTDKAVRPANVMGATKRIAEMIVLELQSGYPKTTYAAVRFGNVLGSNGSVIPIFKRQLANGQPLTVTHPEITRYFMTIPEAVQLILQASLLPGLGGHIAMLEMGDPVRIVDLARNLITLSGGSSNGDRIVYTGLRPGEKLHEELVAPDENTFPTSIPKVRLVIPPDGMIPKVVDYVEEWEQDLAAARDTSVLRTLAGMFSGLQLTIADDDDAASQSIRVGSEPAIPLRRRVSHGRFGEDGN